VSIACRYIVQRGFYDVDTHRGADAVRIGIVVCSKGYLVVPRRQPDVRKGQVIAGDGAISKLPPAASGMPNDLPREIHRESCCHCGIARLDTDARGTRHASRMVLVAADGRWVGPGLTVNVHTGDKSGTSGTPARRGGGQVG